MSPTEIRCEKPTARADAAVEDARHDRARLGDQREPAGLGGNRREGRVQALLRDQDAEAVRADDAQ
jgi:hypothetical protein